MSGIEIPVLRNDEPSLKTRMSENAYEKILPARYLEKNEDGEVVEEQEEVFERVAKNIAVAEAVHSGDDLSHVSVDCIHDHFDEDDVGYDFDFGTVPLNEETAKFFSYDKLMDELEGEEYADAVHRMSEWKIKFHEHMDYLKLMPNTPTIINAGTRMQQLSACFVNSPKDDIRDIGNTETEAKLIFQSGGGVGYDFGKLRPYGDPVGSTGGIASGPITFMQNYDSSCETIAQGGVRRGAQMATMPVIHPDIIHFIHAKNRDVSLAHQLKLNDPDDPTYTDFGEAIEEAREIIDEEGRVPDYLRNAVEGHLSNFNISVTITHDFMEALENDEDYTLINPRTEEPHIVTEYTKQQYEWFDLDDELEIGEEMTLPAEEIWTRIVNGAYENGEPGVMYIDTVNDEHSYDVEKHPEYEMTTSNPCAEQNLMEYEACNLAHINLSTIVDEDRNLWNEHWSTANPEDIEAFLQRAIDWHEFDERIEVGTRFLDNVVTMSRFPIEEIEETVRKNRKIGLGIMGLAQLYIQLGVEYGSDEANEIARQLMKHINHKSKEVSHELALERGNFENWEDSKYSDIQDNYGWVEKHCGDWVNDEPRISIAMRNHNSTTVAPTGTTSLLSNTTGGCEPIFNVAFYKNVTDDIQGDEMLVEFDSLFLQTLKENNIDVDEAKKEAQELMEMNEFERPSDIPIVPDEMGNLFVTTGDLSAKEHASVMCALQEGVDSSISKTLNAPHDATLDDAKEVFEYVYENGGKSVTFYRDGSRTKQVQTTRKDNQEVDSSDEDESDSTVVTRRNRPKTVDAQVERINTGLGSLYVTISEDDIGPLEVFAYLDKSGSTMQASTEAIGKLSSVGLQYGVPPDEIVDQLKGISGPNVGWDDGDAVESIPDGIGTAFERYLEEESDENMIGMNHPTTKVDVESSDEEEKTGEVCPECGEMMAIEEGCAKCYNCGYSRC